MSRRQGGGPPASYPQNHRRMFRGRGGPTDRRSIPHPKGRRKTGLVVEDETTTIEHHRLVESRSDDDDDNNNTSDGWVTDNDSQEEEHEKQQQGESNQHSQEEMENRLPTNAKPAEIPSNNPSDENFLNEVLHLQKRITNVSKSIQLSSDATLSLPSVYQNNVLFAVQNCVKEWHAILKFNDGIQKDDPDILKNAKATALCVFQLIQHSVQCGPLKGSKPGYMKRCGSEVAALVAEYLKTITAYFVSDEQATIPDDCDSTLDNENDAKDSSNSESSSNSEKSDNFVIGRGHLYFTAKQVKAIETWLQRSEKAAASDKKPSKHIQKQQEQGVKNSQMKKKANQKKRDKRIQREAKKN